MFISTKIVLEGDIRVTTINCTYVDICVIYKGGNWQHRNDVLIDTKNNVEIAVE